MSELYKIDARSIAGLCEDLLKELEFKRCGWMGDDDLIILMLDIKSLKA